MQVVRDRIAYRAAKDRRVTLYQAQYFCHCAGRRFERVEPDIDWLVELPRPLNWIAVLGFWFWALSCLVMLTVLLAICCAVAVLVAIATISAM